jgi:DNA-binding NarL/FixJ family response regulator
VLPPESGGTAGGRRFQSWPRGNVDTVTIRVVVADDSLLVREGIEHLLERRHEIEVVATCDDYVSLRAAIEAVEPDVIVTDVRMPPGQSDEGIRIANELRDDHPEIGVVVVSQHADPSYALALFERGSDRRAYLLKERIHRIDELAAAIVAVAAGESVIDAKVVDGLVSHVRRAGTPFTRLTKRELQILELMAQGKNNAGIAATLFLTEHSVEKYVSAVFTKLDLGPAPDVHRRVAAVLLYLSAQ